MRRILPLIVVLASACTTTVAPPGEVLTAYADAIRSGQCARAFSYLAAGAESESEFVASCESHGALYEAQADAILSGLSAAGLEVEARVPVDRLRSVALAHVDGSWFIGESVSLIDGGKTPVASMAALAAALDSEAVAQLLGLLSTDMREQYASEIEALASALASGGERELEVFGDVASVTVGDVTIRLLREQGSWRVSGVDQPQTYSDYGYEDW